MDIPGYVVEVVDQVFLEKFSPASLGVCADILSDHGVTGLPDLMRAEMALRGGWKGPTPRTLPGGMEEFNRMRRQLAECHRGVLVSAWNAFRASWPSSWTVGDIFPKSELTRRHKWRVIPVEHLCARQEDRTLYLHMSWLYRLQDDSWHSCYFMQHPATPMSIHLVPVMAKLIVIGAYALCKRHEELGERVLEVEVRVR